MPGLVVPRPWITRGGMLLRFGGATSASAFASRRDTGLQGNDMADPPQIIDVLERFAAFMAGTYDINDVLYELGDSTAELLGAKGAGVSVADDQQRLTFVTATSEDVIDVECAQQRNQAGPCVEAFSSGEIVMVRRLDDVDGWQDYRDAADRAGFVSMVAVPLWTNGTSIGSLDVFDDREREWNEDELRLARALADIAATYLVHAGRLAEQTALADQLQYALDARVVIEQAKGMLAREHQIPVGEAFDLIRGHSRRNNISIREIARSIVDLELEIPRHAP